MTCLWSLLLLVTVASATKSGYYPHPLQCYQCAYSAPDVVHEEIQVPRIVYEDVEVPRIVIDEVEVPRVVIDEIEVPRVVIDIAKVPRVVKEVVVPSKKAHYAGYYPVIRTHLVYDTVETSRTVIDIEKVERTVIDIEEVERTVIDIEQVSKTVYDTEVITKTTPGGWEKCGSSFTHDEAIEFGVDVWDCHENCYTRLEGDNLYRGCYKGEYAVDPHLLGCHEQNGAKWCFCEGPLCNHGAAH